MILVTCAGGKTGRAIVAALVEAGQNVRAMAGRKESETSLAGLGAADIVSGALTDPQAVADAMQGIEAVYYIAPNMTPDERRIGDIVIDAAKSAGVEKFVFHSTLHTQIESGELLRRRQSTGGGAGLVIEQRDGQGGSQLVTLGRGR